MSPRRAAKSHVPDAFLSQWHQHSHLHGASAKPPSADSRPAPVLLRRPPTACAHCRAAKVRCSPSAGANAPDRGLARRQQCRRCAVRGLTCGRPRGEAPSPSPSLSSSQSASPAETVTDGDSTLGTFVDQQRNSAYTPSSITDQEGCQEGRSPAGSSSSPSSCPCRGNLMLCVPKFASVMHDIGTGTDTDTQTTTTTTPPPLDDIFTLVASVADCVDRVLGCTCGPPRCTDLPLIMSVLQETVPCFEHISQRLSSPAPPAADHDGDRSQPRLQPQSQSQLPVELQYGSHRIALCDNTTLRAVLAAHLVSRVAALVMAVRKTGQNMLDAARFIEGGPRNGLARANIQYLEATITLVQGALKAVDEAVGRCLGGGGGGGGGESGGFYEFAASLLGRE